MLPTPAAAAGNAGPQRQRPQPHHRPPPFTPSRTTHPQTTHAATATSCTNYPRLLPPPISDTVITASYPATLLSRLTAILRGTDVYEMPSEVNLSFIALCHYNLIHLVGQPEMGKVHARLEGTSTQELVHMSRTVQLGIHDCLLSVDIIVLARGGASQHQITKTTASGSGSGSLAQGTGTPRSQALAAQARERDSGTCMLTGQKSPLNEVAHIFPYSLCREANSIGPLTLSTAKPNFRSFLHLFAGETITSKLEAYLLERTTSSSGKVKSRINRLENLMTLSPVLSRMWDACMITLTPVGDPLATITDSTLLEGYDVIFEVLPRHKRDKYIDLSEISGKNLGVRMLESEDDEISTTYIYDWRLGRRLVSGMVIRLETRDARRWPMPHPDLLRLHGAVARVVRCAGATGERRFEFEEDEDEEVEEEVEEKRVGSGPMARACGEEAEWHAKGKSEQEIGFALKRFMEETEASGDENVKPTWQTAVSRARGMTSSQGPTQTPTRMEPPAKSHYSTASTGEQESWSV
ncbi:hypothetical protein BGX38DRAFT_1143603 [Terfezia claveryi]|nr:hypothetical protein BGX38DRAFT_1143603 [Terfezia claveryi]